MKWQFDKLQADIHASSKRASTATIFPCGFKKLAMIHTTRVR